MHANNSSYASPNGGEDPRLFPLLAKSFAGLPKTALLAPEHDLNFDEIGAYALALQKEAVPVHFQVDHGLPHAHWLVGRHPSPAMNLPHSFKQACQSCRTVRHSSCEMVGRRGEVAAANQVMAITCSGYKGFERM